ncbi:mannose-1-phosphate guanylyltransferase [Hyphococcus sp.]|uniref:mannose-1-phosphate guanylyltransferase n=1 Tax=Hyphococcus sp. TaxID=2038636 RepID=UPI003CCB98D4
MSGGSGTRLWPMSRQARPKQFLNLVTDRSLFQETVLRLADNGDHFSPPLIIGGKMHEEIIAAQLIEIGVSPAAIILEPCPRNTAAVAAIAAEWTKRNNPEAAVFLSPADHHVADTAAFQQALLQGAGAAHEYIVTFGIEPDRPHTGYGYIQSGDAISDKICRVAAFREKPDAAMAQAYLDQGGFFWNAGLFLFKPQIMLDEFERYATGVAVAAKEALMNAAPGGAASLLDEAAFGRCQSISIDYAIMEKTDRAAVVPSVKAGWSDIGSWSEVKSDNLDDHFLSNATNISIRSDGPMVGAVGVENLIIVATGDAVLVAHRDSAQDVRTLVEELKKRGREDLL